MLLPDKNKATKRKTAVKKRDLNPEFNDRSVQPLMELDSTYFTFRALGRSFYPKRLTISTFIRRMFIGPTIARLTHSPYTNKDS